MNHITENWSSKDWMPQVFNQKDGKTNITSGSDYVAKAVKFKCSVHGPSREVYPQKTDGLAVLTNVAFTVLYFPMKWVTAVGNAVVGSGNLLYGTYESVSNFSDKQFSTRKILAITLAALDRPLSKN